MAASAATSMAQQEVVRAVRGMAEQGSPASKVADKFGLAVQNVQWEDCARAKDSVWGPCISDMTLQVEGSAMPAIRFPNFTDLTCDVPLNKINLVVGNEKETTAGPAASSEQFKTVTLLEYLKDFRDYLHRPSSWKGSARSLLAPGSTHAIVSAQACFLPMAQGSEAEFNVALYNYQSEKGDPTVLAIIATSKGTSAQVVENVNGKQMLYFNKAGQRCSFIGQRLSDHRKETGGAGVSTEGPMTDEEKKDNVVMIIQVPLKKKVVYRSVSKGWFSFGSDDYDEGATLESCSLPQQQQQQQSQSCNVEDAMVKVGESQGPFTEVNSLEIERDDRFPVRVTLQFYKTTSNGVVTDKIMEQILKQVQSPQKNADYIGSLVVNPNAGRPTEFKQTGATDALTPGHPAGTSASFMLPQWWGVFWQTHGRSFPGITSDQAARCVINSDPLIASCGSREGQEKALAIARLARQHNQQDLEKSTQGLQWNALG